MVSVSSITQSISDVKNDDFIYLVKAITAHIKILSVDPSSKSNYCTL